MKKYIRFGVLVLLTLLLPIHTDRASAADVDNFIINSFVADYHLSRDEQKVSRLKVEEQIIVEFPSFDQNHGILRAIPRTYQNHPLELKVEKVTDSSGRLLPYSESESNNNLVLKIGDAKSFAHGKQEYNIAYTMSNVTANFADHDEFYWDINGDQWKQATEYVAIRLHLTKDLFEAQNTPFTACYTGNFGSSDQSCQIHQPQSTFVKSDPYTIGFETTKPLTAEQTLTTVAAFKKDTFVAYAIPLGTILHWAIMLFVLGILPPAIALFIVIRNWRRYGRDPKGKGVIIPQYLPPKEVSVISSNIVLKETFVPSSISAQIIDLAVRHYIRVYELKEKKVFKDKTNYELELLRSPLDLFREEQELIKLLFGSSAAIGAKVNLNDLSKKLYKDTATIGKNVSLSLTAAGYFMRAPDSARQPYIIWGIVLLIIGFCFIPYTLGLGLAGLILLISSTAMPARTQKGVELRDYLLGLKQYMKIAEAERLKILQSPHGDLTEKIDINDKKQLIKLYEKLLPYAMLFGIEKEWAKQFASLYEQQPDWYSGSNTFNAVYFASALHSFTVASTANFSPPSSSSSSGVSGGFSGGGGGGGGGGGW